jgi:hypothetical protein
MDLAMGAEPIRQKKQNWSPAEEKSAYPIYKTGASPSMLAGLINTWATDHKRRWSVPHVRKMEREERIELSWPAW